MIYIQTDGRTDRQGNAFIPKIFLEGYKYSGKHVMLNIPNHRGLFYQAYLI